MPSQIQRDLAAWSETELETDDEGAIPRQNQLVRPPRSCAPQHHYSQTKGGGPKQQEGMFPVACIDTSR